MGSASTLSTERYLAHIGCQKAKPPTAGFLAELQENHIRSVPYENLDILAGREVSLKISDVYAKIITQHRGGYCFELNALFAWLLRQLGYEVIDYVARFWRDEPNLPPKRRHHVLGVKSEGRWYLADVGVGGVIPLQPLPLIADMENIQGGECYRLVRDPRFGWVLEERHHENWRRIYTFTQEPQEPEDFAFANFWCQNAAESIFRKGPILAIRNREGRNSLAGGEVRLFRPQGVEVITPADDREWHEAVRKYFGLQLPENFPWSPRFEKTTVV